MTKSRIIQAFYRTLLTMMGIGIFLICAIGYLLVHEEQIQDICSSGKGMTGKIVSIVLYSVYEDEACDTSRAVTQNNDSNVVRP